MRRDRQTTRWMRALAIGSACAAASAALMQAQGRGSAEWTTASLDAQRTGWLRSDARLTKEALEKHELRFLWKAQFDNDTRQLNSLTEPIILDRLIGFRGFKALAFIGGSADRLFAIDTDLGKPYWTSHLNYSANTGGQPPSSWACPGGLMATPSRRTSLAPSAFGGGRGGGGRGGRSGSAVGEPGRGAAVLSEAPQGRAGGRGRGAAVAPAGPVAPPAVPASPAVAPIPFGGVDPVYAVATDGFLHTIRSSNGTDADPPVPFLPPSAKPAGLLYIDGIVYTSTAGECGAAPNAVWAIDLTTDERKVSTWETGGASVAGSSGPALGTGGTLYVAVGADVRPASAPQPKASAVSNAVVALDRRTLARKDWFTADGADFNASPTVVRYKDRDLVAVTANDGRLYLLDGDSLGGADHRTPLHVTAKFTAAGAGTALATWEDPENQGTRWILATASGVAPAAAAGGKPPAAAAAGNGTVVAFKLVEQNGKIALERGWTSRPLVTPLGPIVVNGIVFAASSGEYKGAPRAQLTVSQRAQRSTPAVLYALDGATGKELWNSGRTITSFARAGLSAGAGQVYLVTYDNTLYAFGIPMEH
jgi:hypothetical protein